MDRRFTTETGNHDRALSNRPEIGYRRDGGSLSLAHHIILNLDRAMEVLNPEITQSDPVFSERFLREARISANLQHPNIVPVIDIGADPDTDLLYMVMRYIDGGTVHDLLRRGVLAELDALRLTAEIAKALIAAAKMNMVHRDIKPANIMLSKEGEVLLADMGIAKFGPDSNGMTGSLTMQTIIGTMNYASPIR